MLASPDKQAYICDDCIELSKEIIEYENNS